MQVDSCYSNMMTLAPWAFSNHLRMVEDARQLSQPFDRPSAIRRLTEFFIAVKGSTLDRFKHREKLFEKMVTVVGRSLGDEVKLQ